VARLPASGEIPASKRRDNAKEKPGGRQGVRAALGKGGGRGKG
jgi:hypothetical protein